MRWSATDRRGAGERDRAVVDRRDARCATPSASSARPAGRRTFSSLMRTIDRKSLHDQRRQAERRFVEQQQFRFRHQRAADAPASAARRRSSSPPPGPSVLSRGKRSSTESRLAHARGVGTRKGAHHQIVAHAHIRNTRAPRNHGDAELDDRLRAKAVDAPASNEIVPLRILRMP